MSKSKNLVKAKSKYGRNAECKAAVKTSMKIQKMVLLWQASASNGRARVRSRSGLVLRRLAPDRLCLTAEEPHFGSVE